MPVLLALLSSLLWGTSDFLGGTAARRLPAAAVVGLSQALALVLLVPAAVVLGARPDSLLPGVVAGAVGLLGLGAFYAALAGGTMGVVAPVASLGVLLPVSVGLVRGESPSALQTAGIVLAVAGVVLASGPELSGGGPVRPLVLAVAAACAFGLVTVLLADGSRGPAGAVVVTVLVMRLTSVSLAATAYLAVRRRGFRTRAARGDVGLLAAVGLGDLGANACYAVATRGGLLSVVAVLGSLYPVATVLLARQLHAERLRPVQVVGVAGALAGVALLAAG